MTTEGAPAVERRLHRLSTWFDPESAAVVTILFGLFQLMLSVLLTYVEPALPKFFILPLCLGIITVAAGSFTMANERNPGRLQLRGCACSNVVGLLGAILAFCLYCYSLSIVREELCVPMYSDDYRYPFERCPVKMLTAYRWSVTLLLLLCDTGAMILHGLLSVSAFKALKTD